MSSAPMNTALHTTSSYNRDCRPTGVVSMSGGQQQRPVSPPAVFNAESLSDRAKPFFMFAKKEEEKPPAVAEVTKIAEKPVNEDPLACLISRDRSQNTHDDSNRTQFIPADDPYLDEGDDNVEVIDYGHCVAEEEPEKDPLDEWDLPKGEREIIEHNYEEIDYGHGEPEEGSLKLFCIID